MLRFGCTGFPSKSPRPPAKPLSILLGGTQVHPAGSLTASALLLPLGLFFTIKDPSPGRIAEGLLASGCQTAAFHLGSSEKHKLPGSEPRCSDSGGLGLVPVQLLILHVPRSCAPRALPLPVLGNQPLANLSFSLREWLSKPAERTNTIVLLNARLPGQERVSALARFHFIKGKGPLPWGGGGKQGSLGVSHSCLEKLPAALSPVQSRSARKTITRAGEKHG